MRNVGALGCTYTHGIYSSFWHFWHSVCHFSLLEVAVDCLKARDWCSPSGSWCICSLLLVLLSPPKIDGYFQMWSSPFWFLTFCVRPQNAERDRRPSKFSTLVLILLPRSSSWFKIGMNVEHPKLIYAFLLFIHVSSPRFATTLESKRNHRTWPTLLDTATITTPAPAPMKFDTVHS